MKIWHKLLLGTLLIVLIVTMLVYFFKMVANIRENSFDKASKELVTELSDIFVTKFTEIPLEYPNNLKTEEEKVLVEQLEQAFLEFVVPPDTKYYLDAVLAKAIENEGRGVSSAPEEGEDMVVEMLPDDKRIQYEGERPYVYVKDIQYENGWDLLILDGYKLHLDENELPKTLEQLENSASYKFSFDHVVSSDKMIGVAYKSMDNKKRLTFQYKISKRKVVSVSVQLSNI